MSKNPRQTRIVELVKEREIETQEELQALLKEDGYDVTQATVSRDIKKLRLTKVALADGRYKYATVAETGIEYQEKGKFRTVLGQVALSVTGAGNLVIVKTIPGAAQAACAAIDSQGYKQIAGSIAGDDTVFLAVSEIDEVETVIRKLQELIGVGAIRK